MNLNYQKSLKSRKNRSKFVKNVRKKKGPNGVKFLWMNVLFSRPISFFQKKNTFCQYCREKKSGKVIRAR